MVDNFAESANIQALFHSTELTGVECLPVCRTYCQRLAFCFQSFPELLLWLLDSKSRTSYSIESTSFQSTSHTCRRIPWKHFLPAPWILSSEKSNRWGELFSHTLFFWDYLKTAFEKSYKWNGCNCLSDSINTIISSAVLFPIKQSN